MHNVKVKFYLSVNSLSLYNYNPNFGAKLTVLTSPNPKARSLAETQLLERAENFAQSGNYYSAINTYKSYLQSQPYDDEINLSLAKTYTYNEQYLESIPYFERYLSSNKSDIENITMLGEAYKKTGNYTKALEYFNRALAIEPNYDYAKRNILDTQNLQLAKVNPKKARQEKYSTAMNNLTQAIKIAKNYLPQGYTDSLKDVVVSFDKTAKMGGRSNIAQYEHLKRKISVTDEYTYADPRLTGAYIIHEFVHSKDNDPYTSIREEQDAYRVQAEYWLNHAQDVYDPEMDYVADLYKESARALDERVAEIYKLRDPDIAQTSYNHPPSKVSSATSILSENPAVQPLKEYDVIV